MTSGILGMKFRGRSSSVVIRSSSAHNAEEKKKNINLPFLLVRIHDRYYNWDLIPTSRGFDSALGYYNGMEDYYTHIRDGGYVRA